MKFRGINRSHFTRQKRNGSPDNDVPHPHKYRIQPCNASRCILLDKAILFCWCDPADHELKRFHNEWTDILDSENVTLEKIAEMDQECFEKYGTRLYKKPISEWGFTNWSNFDFSKMGHLIAIMG